jgi:hypothetical protein
MLDEQRTAPRYPVHLPIEGGGVRGRTVDISATGIAFESVALLRPGEDVMLTIETASIGRPTPVRCRARVIRVDRSRYVVDGRETMRVGATVRWLDEPNSQWFDLVSEACIA